MNQLLSLAIKYHGCDSMPDDREADEIKKAILKELVTKHNELARLVFYTGLRVLKRHAAALDSGRETGSVAYRHEIERLEEQFRRAVTASLLPAIREARQAPAHFRFVQGDYSKSCTLDFANSFGIGGAKIRIEQRSATDSMPDCDVIVTDPPYGINTQENPHALADLYTRMIRNMLLALGHGGQLVLCLPEVTRTGQHVAYYTQKDVVIQQVLHTANELNMDVEGIDVGSVPRQTQLYRPPYYWESEKALRRSILHFTFRKRRA